MVSETEPDYRMSLAAERTYLAYLRTGLGLIAGGVAVAALVSTGAEPLRRGLGVALVLLGLVVSIAARPRWRDVDRAMRRGEPMPPAVPVVFLGWALGAVGIGAIVLVLAL